MSYWEEFYKKEHTLEPSSFAVKVANTIKADTLVDLGCGNGRDSYYLSKYYKVDGVDSAVLPKCGNNVWFHKEDIDYWIDTNNSPDIVYARFVFHTFPTHQALRIIDWTNNYLAAEYRIIGDEPTEYTTHKRFFVNSELLLNYILNTGFKILYYEQGRNLARYKQENPLVGRIICQRKR